MALALVCRKPSPTLQFALDNEQDSNATKRDYALVTELLITNLHDSDLQIHPPLLHLHRINLLDFCKS